MSTFNEREKEFEARFSHDQELAFKITARRNKLLGLWAAHHLGLVGAAAEAYAKEVVAAEIAKDGDRQVLAKVTADFTARGIEIAAPRIADELRRCAAEAEKQVKAE